MKAEVKKLAKSEVEITITVPYADYEKAEKQAMEDISKEIKVPGFRSGHIPEAIVREQVDASTITAVTLEKIIPQTYAKAVVDNDLNVIAQPKVDIKSHVKKAGDELVYTAKVAIVPEVQIGDYKKIKVAKPKVKVEKKQIDETVAMIMDRFAQWQDVKRKAKNDDRAEITFEGFDAEGKAIDGTVSKNHPVILGSKTMIPGFEEAVIGMEIGENKEFDIDFPKDYHAKAMQGKKVKFKLSLDRLEEKMEQKLDEAMVEKVTGQKQSVEDFMKRVEADLLSEMQTRAQHDHDSKVVQEIIKITKAELPEALVEQEIEILKDEQKERLKHQGVTWEQFLQHINKKEEDFAKDHRKAAEERLTARLGVSQILKDAKIEVTDDDVVKKIEEITAGYPEQYKSKVAEHYKKGSEGYRNLKNSLAADKLIEMLTKHE
jgi:trigger factor